MHSAHRDRPDHRGTALCTVTAVLLLCALLIVPVSANSAAYYVADDGKTLSTEITLVNQSGYLLTSPGFLGEGAELKAENITLTAENGTVINGTGKSAMELEFPKGNYTLTYTAPIDGNVVYARYLSPHNVTVYLPVGFSTDHLILGTASSGGMTYTGDNIPGSFSGATYGTVVVWTDTKEIQMRFYPDKYETYLLVAGCLWLILFAAAGYRYLLLRKKATEYL